MDGYSRMYALLRQTAQEERANGLHLRIGRVTCGKPLCVVVGEQEQEAERFISTVSVSSGDRVLLLTEDDQSFYLIGRVIE